MPSTVVEQIKFALYDVVDGEIHHVSCSIAELVGFGQSRIEEDEADPGDQVVCRLTPVKLVGRVVKKAETFDVDTWKAAKAFKKAGCKRSNRPAKKRKRKNGG